ncbi:DNA polymerase II [Motilimonas eburnea]|uniref:DNA polymerase II n=1 Tax=Motilimonas eburnea TaxID=1737488 RepID=UPI001E33DEDB|nr:DNA polymerase II [Motilimonas eburnea]
MVNLASGFILSRHSHNTQAGVSNEYWLKDSDTVYRVLTAPEQVVFFIANSLLELARPLLKDFPFQVTPLALTTFDHQKVSGVYFNSSYHAHQAAKRLAAANIETFEADIKAPERHLMERFVQAEMCFTGQFIHRRQYIEVRGARIKPAKCIPTLKTVSLDIECSQQEVLYSIGLYADWGQWVFMRGEPVPDAPAFIHWCSSEHDLLTGFIAWLAEHDPDIIIGWAVVQFDFRILVQRAERLGITPSFGRANSKAKWRDRQQGNGFLDIQGRVVIDGIEAFKAASYVFENYSLEHVANQLLGEGKELDTSLDKLSQINYQFQHDKVALAQYNLQDCRLVWRLFEHCQLLDFLQQRSRLTGLELGRAGGSVAAFTHLYLPKVHRAGYVAPNLPLDGGLASPGGYVMDSQPGLYKHVLVLDYKSLYPSIIRTFKIDPVGMIEGLKQPEQAIEGFVGGYFSRQTHFLPEIISQLWQARDHAKAARDSAASQAIKIIMNSFYGVLGSGGCRFYDPRLASSITLRGHQIMKQTQQWIEQQGWQVIYGDTDSTFVWLGNELKADQDPDQIGQDLARYINQAWQQKLAEEFALDCFLEMEYETHYSKFFMPTIRGTDKGSKKRYAGLIEDDQGQKLVFKGLETVRSDWTELARLFQTRLYEMVFAEQDPCDYIRELVQQTRQGAFDQQLVYRKRLGQPIKAYVKNVPPHARAAINADLENEKLGKPLQYQHKGVIRYVQTLVGPQAVEYVTSSPDYDHYIEKQLQPIADAILPAIGLSFAAIVDDQLGLF